MSMRAYWIVPCIVCAICGSCSGNRPASFVSQRDSAGVRIVESSAPLWGDSPGWTIDPVPVLDLTTSGSGPAHEFYRAGDATRLPDGSLAVADGGSSEVRLFSSTGEVLRTMGREGEGPGEFRRLTTIDRYRGDSLIGFDLALARATVLSLLGGEPRVIRLGSPYVLQLLVLDDATLVGMLVWPSVLIEGGEAGLVRMPVPVVRFAATGDVIDTLVMSAGHEEVRIAAEYGFSSARPLFGKESHVATHQGQFYLGSADLMQFELYSSDGVLERIARVPDYDLSLPGDAVAAERNARLGDNPSPRRRGYMDALPVPDTRPAYSELLVDAEGCVWAAEHIGSMTGWLSVDPRSWEVFGADGTWLGRVQTPARFTVFEVGSDYVLGSLRDELDVEHVQLLRLHRRPFH